MLSHAELKAKALSSPTVEAEYDRLADKITLLGECCYATARLTQAAVAAGRNMLGIAENMLYVVPHKRRLLCFF